MKSHPTKSAASILSTLRLLGRHRGNFHDPDGLISNYWAIAVNLDDQSKSYSLLEPDFSSNLPLDVRTPLYPPPWNDLVFDHLPYPPSGFLGGYTVSDGILYVYNSDKMCLFTYDLVLGEEIYSVELTRSFWFVKDRFLYLVVLDGPYNNLCVIWDEYGWEANEYFLHYTRFSVSPSQSSPVIVHESQTFPVSCFGILNIVTLDPSSPGMPIS